MSPATMVIATIIIGVMAVVMSAMASVGVSGRHNGRDRECGSKRCRCEFIAHDEPLALHEPIALFARLERGPFP